MYYVSKKELINLVRILLTKRDVYLFDKVEMGLSKELVEIFYQELEHICVDYIVIVIYH